MIESPTSPPPPAEHHPAPTNDFVVRRSVFIGFSILLTATGFVMMLNRYTRQIMFWEDYVCVAIFPLLFSQIAVGFVLALFGFYDRLRGGDRQHIMRGPWRAKEDSIPLAATAIVVPIYNEEVPRVTRAVANMWRSLEKTGQLDHFDFYICSDSNDPDHWVEEECAWISLCQRLGAFGKIFYRKRRHSINGKSGNVADFCRRWGKRYRYMIVLDADSVMIGPTLVRLVRAMEANPDAGIIQTQPYMVLGSSLFRRVLQFSSHLYGGLFSQGCSMAQMSSGSYWGHNAIIRVAAFIEHCDLPLLPVPDPRKRHVLSHDTVEAALMRRAGYGVWIAYEEPGSYEEGPPNLSDMLTRDRRWCAGNLQHFWFLFARGIEMGSRLQIWIGLMAYLCSPLWLITLLAGSFGAYFRMRFLTLSADPEDLGAAANASTGYLVALTLALLFIPRLLGIVTMLPRSREFGGATRMLLSALAENVFAVLLAPILMMFHTFFVLMTLSGLQIRWTTQNRADKGLTATHCLLLYGGLTTLAAVVFPIALDYLGNAAWWLSPIFAGWLLAPLLAWVTSRSRLGLFLRRWGFFVTPEEVNPPPELQGLTDGASPAGTASPLWVQALLSPYVQAVHLSLVRQGSHNKEDGAPAQSMVKLRERLITGGPQAVSAKDALRLLWNGETVFWLHRELWARPHDQLHPSWLEFQSECERSRLLSEYLLAR
ncbi:MAG: glucans biosynthesis glucosyltransferase MdoH [Verrucomicrobiota bacterium]